MNTDDCKITDCPICMDVIEGNKNCVTTDCGHCFHTSCLMTSVAHNGFGCPYCRTAMAQEVAEEVSEYDDGEGEEEEELYDDYILRGFRFFMNNINGDEHEEYDIEDEEEDQGEAAEEESEESKPAPYFITHKLAEQGVTMEDLVKILLLDHEEYEREDDEFMRISDDMFGKLRIIISNHIRDQEHPPVPLPLS